MKNIKLHWQILFAMCIGILLGTFYQYLYNGEPDSYSYNIVISFGDIFVRLLKMVIVPLIFTSIVTGVSGIGEGITFLRIC